MRRLIYVALIVCFVVSCKKEQTPNYSNKDYIENVKALLKDSVTSEDFFSLDFNNALLSKSEKDQLYFLRIPIKGKTVATDFVLVQTSKNGTVQRGSIVHLEGKVDDYMEGNVKRRGFDGKVLISSLDRKRVLNSSINNGYITAFHSGNNTRATVYAEDVLPEVVVVAYVSGGIDYYSTWLWLNNLFYYESGTGGGGSASGYYGSTGGGYSSGYYGDGSGYYSGGGSGYTTGSGDPYQEDLMEFEPEYIYSVPEIDLWKFFNCFDQVPSAGASYTIKLCVDVPSNSNPGASSASSGSSAGHSFLTVTKSNGSSKISQSFGFYPKSEPSFLDPFASITSTTKDNGGNEYNAAIEMNISESQFETIKNDAIVWAVKQYNLGDYNCTNYALDVFNSVRQTPITISPYKVVLPGDPNPYGPSEPNSVIIEKSPQMLFIKLQEMKTNNVPEAAKISIDQTHNSLSPVSHGECN